MRKTNAGRVLACVFLLGLTAACAGKTVQQEEKPQSENISSAASNTEEISPQEKRISELEKAKKNAEFAKKNAEATAEYHFSLAQAYVAEGNGDRAIEEYKLTLLFDPNSSLVYARLAAEYVKKGMLTAAMETCKEALQRDPKFIDARLMLAGLYSMTRETSLAIAEYDTILKKKPTHEEAAVFKAQVLIEDGKAAEASQHLKRFLKQPIDAPLAWYYLGRAEHRLDHFTEAAQAFRKALALRPNLGQAALALGYLYEEKKKNQEALAVYKEYFRTSQDSSAGNRIATIYLKEEKYQEALPYLESMALSDPEDLNVRVKLGLVQMELKQHDKAVQTFKSLLEKNPESDRVRYYLGMLFEETKRFEEAIAELKQIKPDSNLFSEAALHVSFLLKQTNQVEAAKKFMREATEKSPKNAGFYLFSASLEEESGNLIDAVQILEKALGLFPEEEKVKYYLGNLYDKQGETDKSLAQMESILAQNPDNPDALNFLGYTWTVKGMRLDDAEKLIRKANRLRPNNGYIQDSWGWHLYMRGRFAEAVVELERARKLKPDEPTILEHLGDAYAKNDLYEKATLQYREALRLTTEEESRQKLSAKIENIHKTLAKKKGKSHPDGNERIPAGDGKESGNTEE